MQESTLDESGVELTDCGDDTSAAMCKLMPPIMDSQDQIDNITTAGQTLNTSFFIIVIVNLIVALLIGGVIE